MKKIISMLLIILLTVISVVPAHAKNVRSGEDDVVLTYEEDVADGKLYVQQDRNRIIAIINNEKTKLVDISIKYVNDENKVYHWVVENGLVDNLNYKDIIAYANDNFSSAEIIDFYDVTYDEPIEVNSNARLSAVADLYEDLEKYVGSSRYKKKLMYTRKDDGNKYQIYETLTFRCVATGYKSWSKKISVSSFIVSVIGAVATDARVKMICEVFGLVSNASSLIPAGKVNKYICRAYYSRFTTINGSSYAYTMTDKTVEYKGYEDADGAGRARLDKATKDTYYSDSSSYFSSYVDQYKDARAMFKKIGQKS